MPEIIARYIAETKEDFDELRGSFADFKKYFDLGVEGTFYVYKGVFENIVKIMPVDKRSKIEWLVCKSEHLGKVSLMKARSESVLIEIDKNKYDVYFQPRNLD